MQVVTIFCEFCSGIVLEPGQKDYHSWCYAETMTYRRQLDGLDGERWREGYIKAIAIQRGRIFWFLNQKRQNSVVVVYGKEQEQFIDLIYKDLKDRFKAAKFWNLEDLSFPLEPSLDYTEFTVAKDWVLYFYGQKKVCAHGRIIKDISFEPGRNW